MVISFKQKDVYDYELLYLDDGKIKYAFNAGTGAGVLVSAQTVNDGKLHSVTTTRRSRDGKLTVDGKTVTGRSNGGATALNSISKIYVGGAPPKLNTLQKLEVRCD